MAVSCAAPYSGHSSPQSTLAGEICAAINAATLALVDAGIGLKDFVVASSAAFIEKTIVLDPNYTEQATSGPELPVAFLPKSGDVSGAAAMKTNPCIIVRCSPLFCLAESSGFICSVTVQDPNQSV